MSVNVLSQIALWLSTLVNLILVLVLYRQFGLTAMASAAGHDNDGVAVGALAPPLLVQPTPASAMGELDLDGSWSVVLFGTPHCEPCVEALDRLNRELPRLSGRGLRVVAAFNGIPESSTG